jgi:serine/threonine protein kinase
VNEVNDSARTTTVVSIGAKSTLFVGAVLRDRYVLEQLLGEGGMGRVFLATDREMDGSDRSVAIKVLGDVFRQHPQSLSVMRKEATNAQRLNHPNIVGVYTFDRDGQNVFIVMEYMRGQSLDHFIKKHKEGVRFKEAWPIIRGCAEALKYMHAKKIIHSDFKPGNVFVTEDDEIKVLDLGIARTIDETVALDGRTRFDPTVQLPLGLTPAYASCEMFEGAKPDGRDDIYALGCVAYELLSGRHPFEYAKAPEARDRKLKPARPKGVGRRHWRALQNALSFDRASRTPSADQFLIEMDRPAGPKRVVLWAVVAAALLVLGVLMAVMYRGESPDDQFIAEQIAAHPGGESDAASAEDLLGLSGQAGSSLQLAKSALEEKHWDMAAYYLHDGPTSAYFSYKYLLMRASSPTDIRAAAEGLLGLSKLYAIPAQDPGLRDKDNMNALRWACQGLKINPFEPTLRAIYVQLKETVGNDDIATLQPCAAIQWKTSDPLTSGP